VNSVLDNSLVGLALALSAGYAVFKLGPRAARRAMLKAFSRAAAGTPAFLGLRRTAQRLAATAPDKPPGACGGCDDCGSAEPAGKSVDGEVRVPVAKIGRR
jgi:hypothetical protein